MEVQDRSRSPSRRTSRVEQVVGRWLRRSRDLGNRSHSLGRDKVVVDGKTAESSGCDQRNYSFRFSVQIQRDPKLNTHGLILSDQTPILVQEVLPGGPADGRLVPGDQPVKINNVAVDDLTPEQAAEIIRECQDTLTMTILRTMLGPKSSFITPEKRAKLKSNPVKVHFAEEVEVNGHSQGNSLLFLPNVLKVYLENGQTKAFKFEPSTTVKDIVMTLKEKLSLSRIEHFSLVLEQQHSATKLLLLHDEENIQQVIEKKEAHDYRCLFRVCFMPKEPQNMLLEDPVAFEYLYLQGVNDVLQERFAVEMRCNSALRLAALHIQERLAGCGQSPKTNLKTITKTWGIENFVSSTLLRNMREKDLRKAISYHMKKSQSQYESKQKGLSVDQARTIYLEELSDLKSFGGKSFSATMMLQDRESTVTLLVGARYGVSQVINHKLSILSTLTEFSSITRIELMPESDRVSLVKIYLQDIKPIALLLESAAAKDMSCLIAGYCRVFVDSNLNIFPWMDNSKKHRISAEEGYVSRCGSDSDDSSELDAEAPLTTAEKSCPRARCSSDTDRRKRMDRERSRNKDGKEKREKMRKDRKQTEEKDADTEKEKLLPDENTAGNTVDTEDKETSEEADMTMDRTQDGGRIQIEVTDSDSKDVRTTEGEDAGQENQTERGQVQAAEEQPVSETSDSCRTDSHVLTSPSCDSLDALEEDDLIACSSSSIHPEACSQTSVHAQSCLQIHPYTHGHAQPHLLTPPPAHSHPLIQLAPHYVFDGRGGIEEGGGGGDRRSGNGADPRLVTPVSTAETQLDTCSVNPCPEDSSLCFAELSRLVEYLPSPPEASEDEEDEEEELRRRRTKVLLETDEAARRAEGGSTSKECSLTEQPLSPSLSSPSCHMDFVFNFEESDARCYYKLCSSITPDSARSLPQPPLHSDNEEQVEGDEAADPEAVPVLQPPPGFGDSSSDDEFYDARDRFTSPEDPSSGAFPRDFCTKRKLNVLNTLRDIRTSLGDEDRDADAKEDRNPGEEGGGATETLLQLRKRSRKRRSFMETDYTSRVSYPEPHWESRQGLLRTRRQRTFLTEDTDAQMLSSDPEGLVQIQDASPTIASLTHSEWEPAQLESKPILATPSSKEPGTGCGLGSQDQIRDAQGPLRTRKQEMEMEPDSMESKSVTDFVKPVSPTITVVRCRVDPDGKESADRRGDGKEEVLGEEEMDERKAEGQTEEAGNVLLSGHMFLPEVIVGGDKGEEVGEEQTDGVNICSKRPLIGAEKQSDSRTVATCLLDASKKQGNVLPLSHRSVPEQKSNGEEEMFEGVSDDSKPPSGSPPPPPPPSPLSPAPVHHHSHSEDKMSFSPAKGLGEDQSLEAAVCERIHTSSTHLEVPISVIEDGEVSVSSTRKTSEDATDSTNSDSVFDDDEVSNLSFSVEKAEGKDDWTFDSKSSICDISAAVDKVESERSGLHTGSNAGAAITCVHTDDAPALGLIAAKVGALTEVTPPVATPENASISNQIGDKARSHSTVSCIKTQNNFVNPALANVKDHDRTKEYSCKPHFLFQTCSPGIMGRLSVSTLRGKIQNLPLYLSRSQETISQAVEASVVQSPAQDVSRDNGETTITATETHDVESVDFKTVTNAESPESDDSDTTVTASEVEVELFVQTSSASSSHSAVSGVKEDTNGRTAAHRSPLSLVQTEPDPDHRDQILHTGPNKKMPEPITEPPRPTASNLQRDTSGIKRDTPGPVKNAPESQMKSDTRGIKTSNPSPFNPPPIVVTTQNLNGPGLPPQRQSQSSNDRPLMGLCGPAEQHPDSPKTLSSACSVSVCEDTKLDPAPPMKSDFACSSMLVSGCESVIEGVQMPLDACGCPVVYGSCFSGPDGFDDELTVYEFSCRTQNSDVSQAGLPLMTSAAVSSFLSTSTPPLSSSILSPSFPPSILFSSATSELSPLLSPLAEASDCFLSQMHKDILSRLGQRRYPQAPAGFQVLRVDVDQLLSILEGVGVDQTVGGHGGRHPRDTCPAHFTENRQVLQVKARRLTAGCQKVVCVGQSPEEMLLSLAQSFRTLVELAGICLWFSGCDRCDRRNAEAVAGLADVARSFRDFCLAAERASNKRSCQDLSTKLLAKQCTALTASVFCLTQLFRTLTAL